MWLIEWYELWGRLELSEYIFDRVGDERYDMSDCEELFDSRNEDFVSEVGNYYGD